MWYLGKVGEFHQVNPQALTYNRKAWVLPEALGNRMTPVKITVTRR